MNPRMLNYWYMPSSEKSFPEELKSLFSVLWLGEISGNTLVDESGNGNDINITNKDFSTNYIPPTSAATFSLDDVAALKTDDNFDGCWFTDAGAVKQVPVTYFINNDYSRTLVKYSNESPYNVEWIGLLDDAATPTTEEWEQLHTYFKLHIFWSGVLHDFGVLKDNRPLEGQGYKAWIYQIQSFSLTEPSLSVKASINKFCLDLNNADILSGLDRLWVFMLNDSEIVTGAATVSIIKPTSTRLSFIVAPTYTASGFIGNGTTQYANTNFNTLSNAYNFTQNSASRIMYKYNAGSSGGLDGHLSSSINGMFIGSSVAQRINSSVNMNSSFSTTGAEYIAMNRSDSTNIQCYNGTNKSDRTGTSTTPANEVLYLLRNVTAGYCNAGISMYALGKSLTQQQHDSFRTAFLSHKTRLGL